MVSWLTIKLKRSGLDTMDAKESKKIKLLVVPDQFPEDEKDIAGVFIVNYLKCIEPYCDITVLHHRLCGAKKGVKSNWFLNRFWVIRNVVTSKRVPKLIKPFAYLLWLMGAVRLSKKFDDIDLIHAHGTILGGTLAWILSKKLKVPFVLTEHVGPFSKISDSFFRHYWAEKVMKRAEKVFAVSNHLKKEILGAGIKPKKIVVTHNPVDTDFFRYKRTTDNRRMGFASRLVPFKGGLRTVMAFHILEEEFPDWKLVIGGDGPEANLIKEYIAKNNLQERIDFKGYLSRDGFNELLETIDFFVFPSEHESFGLVVAEAMAKGMPVIAPNITGPAEFIGAESGILIDPFNVWEISQAMRKLIHGHQFYDTLVIRRKMIAEHGSNTFGLKLLREYYDVLNIDFVAQKVGVPCAELQD